MLNINPRTLSALVFAAFLLSWYGSATGISQFISEGQDGVRSILAVAVAATGSIIIQALMAVFLTVLISAYVVHMRTRVLYLLGCGIMTTLSVVLAVAFWVNVMDLRGTEVRDVFNRQRTAAISAAQASQAEIVRFDTAMTALADTVRENQLIEAASGTGERHDVWLRLLRDVTLAETELARLDQALSDGIAAAAAATTLDGVRAALVSPMQQVRSTTALATLQAAFEREAQVATALTGPAHQQRWANFATQIAAANTTIAAFAPVAMPELEDSTFAPEHGDKHFAIMLVKKVVTGQPLSGQEAIAVSLAVITDLIFAILIILRAERRRRDDVAEFVHHFMPRVEALNARLKRNDFAGGVSELTETLHQAGKGLFGFDRLFGLVVQVPEGATKTQLAKTVSFLKTGGMAVDVSGAAGLFRTLTSWGDTATRVAQSASVRRPVTVLIPPAEWRLINTLKQVEDLMPPTEDKGTLGAYVRKQRRKKPRVYTATKLKMLDTYFSSAMEASLSELAPARIERIVDAFRSDPRTKRLARKTKEKHEATFRDVIDAVRTDGLLPSTAAQLRVAV